MLWGRHAQPMVYKSTQHSQDTFASNKTDRQVKAVRLPCSASDKLVSECSMAPRHTAMRLETWVLLKASRQER